MGLGILADHALDHVPGTAHVLDSEEQRRRIEDVSARGGRQLKYDKTGKILLVPQPGEGMGDPLNWSLPRRDVATLILSLTSILASTLSPLLAANTVSLAIYFRHNFTDMALLTGYHLLGVGLAGFVIVPSARIWGKRHVYLLGMILIIASCVWAGATGPNYNSFLAARVVQGVGLAPFEALVNASVADMYCVHERGGRMALVNFAVFGGAFATPVFVGIITDRLGYQWTFYFIAIFMAAMVPCVVLWVPETTVWRGEGWGVDSLGNLIIDPNAPEEKDRSGNGSAEGRDGSSTEQEKVPASTSTSTSSPTPSPSYLSTLSPFSGRKTPDPFLKLLLRPFSLFLHPGVLWACLIQGVLIGFTVLIGITLAAIMLGPPLWFGELETGYMYTGAFIGALLGFILSGLIADPSAAWLTRLNGGVYEPEFRLVLVVPQVVFGGAGIIGFGYTAADAMRYGWFWPDFFFALVVLGMVCGAVASALYLVDAHRDMEIEAFTCLLVFKNLFSFALTFKGFDWIVEAGRKGGGVKSVFVAVGAAQVGVCALTVPMYIFGKKNRSFWFRHNVFFKATDWVADKLTFW